MNTEDFIDCSKCRDCPLHGFATKPGIPTRPLTVTGKPLAILAVGEAPGSNEDREGKSWIGYAGQLLEKFIGATGLADYADTYLSNANRCRPPQNARGTRTPTRGQIKTCRKWLAEDIRRLKEQYEEVLVLACGFPAAFSVGQFKSLREALKHQGDTCLDCPTFFTYHPAILHPSHKPALVKAVAAHFDLLGRYIKGQFIPNAIKVTPEVGAPLPDPFPAITSVDIETYGILKGQEQTVFIPIKSIMVDKINYDELVVTVSFAYRDKTGVIRTPLYVVEESAHLSLIRKWFKWLSKAGTLVIGQNIKFDLQYLRAADRELAYWIDPLRLWVDDTTLVSFLLYEQQPEKGLKEQATLFGIADYEQFRSIVGSVPDPWDPKGHQYNCLDSATTLTLYEECWVRIQERFGPASPKLSKACADIRNAIIWDVLELESAGIALDTLKLQKLNDDLQTSNSALEQQLVEQGVVAQGEGSDKSLRELITKGLSEAGLYADKRVHWTDKRVDVSIDKSNMELLLANLPDGSTKESLLLLQRLRKQATLINTYTHTLLTNPRKGITHRLNKRVGIAHPTWYPIPSYHSKSGEDEKSGGTIQGRFSAQRPSIPTFPDPILDCLTTRWRAGILASWDLSQIELRMAAWLSGDPLLMDAYTRGLDLHTEAALQLFPEISPAGIKDSKERKLAKTLNFLVLYKGGPLAYQETAREDWGLELELGFCKETINEWYEKHPVFKAWQDRLIEEARTKGYIELPTGWSRTFALGSSADVYVNEICNFPIQTLSAQYCQSAQFEVLRGIKQKKLRTKIVSNVYDALYADMPTEEFDEVCELMDRYLTNAPLKRLLEDYTGRTVPIEYAKKILDRRPK